MRDGGDASGEACLEAAWNMWVSAAEVELFQCLTPCLRVIRCVHSKLSRLEDKSGLHGPFPASGTNVGGIVVLRCASAGSLPSVTEGQTVGADDAAVLCPAGVGWRGFVPEVA